MYTEVEKSNLSAVIQFMNVMELRLREMERTALNISLNNNLKYFKIKDVGYQTLEAVNELKKYKSSNEFVCDIALYYNNNDKQSRIYTTTTSANPDMYFEYVYKYDDWGTDDFINLVKNITSPVMQPAKAVLFNNSEIKRLATYTYPLAINTVRPNIIVTFYIEESVLTDVMANTLGEYNGCVYVLDEQGNVISSLKNDESDLNPDKILNMAKESKSRQWMERINFDGESYSVIWLKSDYNGWSYIMARKTEQLMGEVNKSRRIFIAVIIAVSLFGVLLAFAFAFGHYKPIRKLVEVIPSQASKYINSQTCSDEFEYVTRTIRGVSKEYNEMSKRLRSKARLIRKEYVIKLLHGKINDLNDLDKANEYYGLKLDYPYYSVLVFLVDECGTTNWKDEKDLILFSITNVTEELSKETGFGYCIEMEELNGVVLLLNIKEEYIKERYISELAYKTKDFFMKYFGLTLTVGVGNIYDKIQLIHESYLEATRAVYYRLVKGYGNVIFYEEIKERQKTLYNYPSQLEEELILAMKAGNGDEAEQIILSIRDHISDNCMAIEAIQCICFGIINSIMKTLNDINIGTGQFLNNEDNVLYSKPFDTIDNLVERIISFCRTICDYINRQKESKNFELRDRIIDIVTNNYKDSSLSLESIADMLDMNPSYISRYFKDQTGYSLMQYLDMFRMNEVKKLLKYTDLPLQDILSQAGYIDKSSFYRKFKKREGVTPLQYRSMAKKRNIEEDNDIAMSEPSDI